MPFFSSRQWMALIAFGSAASMAFALYLQYVVELAVCPLCYTQRVFIIATGVLCFFGAIHDPKALGIRIYSLLALIMASIGAGFAGRHIWLQHLPEGQAPACGPSVQYLLETLPFGEALEVLLMGDGNCAEKVWSFLGFSIPELTFAVFAGMIIVLLGNLIKPQS